MQMLIKSCYKETQMLIKPTSCVGHSIPPCAMFVSLITVFGLAHPKCFSLSDAQAWTVVAALAPRVALSWSLA